MVLNFTRTSVVNGQDQSPLNLFDFENRFRTRTVSPVDARVNLITEGQNHLLKVTLGHADKRPSIKLQIPSTDLSDYLGIAIDIKNLSQYGIAVEAQCMCENSRSFNRSMVWTEPGETDTLFITFYRVAASLPSYITTLLKGMNGLLGGYLRHWEILDLTKITGIEMFRTRPGSDSYIYGQKKTPYTATLSSGIPKSMPSTLDEESFRATCAARLARRNIKNTFNDPWCIGYFVDNEISWPSSNAEEVIETYYRVVKEELKKLAPDKLYLGSRIHNNNAIALAAAGRHCDVISINRYDYTVSGFSLPEGIDKPVIIGEFHFGALDRGLFHTGLRSVLSQKQRARVYTNYVNQAIENPYFVGTHWFQYADQVCTGRNDGENYQIGFIDICDRPYPEMVAAARKIGSYLYTYRSKGAFTPVP